MEDLKTKAGTLTDHVGDYIETYYKLIVLNATEKATGIASVSITSLVLSVISIFALFFISLGFGWWLGERLHNMFAGFAIIAGFYTLCAVLTILLKDKIIPFIQNLMIRKVYEETNKVIPGSDGTETGIAKAA
jgi:hypothetical protein